MTRFTPDPVVELLDGEVFVFGSNVLGLHVAGAAAVAAEKFGAVWGEGEGLFGQSYALPTMGNLVELAAAVGRFLFFAETHLQLTFLVTKVGTGIAGHPLAEVAQLFADSAPNVVLPIEFHNALTEKREQ